MGNLVNIQIKSFQLYVSQDACWTQPKHPVGFPPYQSLKIGNDLIELPATFKQKMKILDTKDTNESLCPDCK